MEVSISLSQEDLDVLDDYVRRAGLRSRSAGVQHAIRVLRYPTLEDDYANAWAEWSESGEAEVWDLAAGDGTGDAPR